MLDVIEVVLTLYLVTVDRGFLVILPFAILHLGETVSFAFRWRDDAYFMRKMKSFFVYRNFVLICLSILLSLTFRFLPNAVSDTELLALWALTLVSSAPTPVFLARHRLFAFSRM